MLLNFKTLLKPKPAKSKAVTDDKKMSVQDWLPVIDVNNNLIIRKDGYFVAGIKITPENMNLKSKNEKKRLINAVKEAINGLQDPFQKFCIGRPVDLDSYIRDLEEQVKTKTSISRKKLLQEYLKYVVRITSSGEALEPQFYILLSQAPGPQAKEELLQKLRDLRSELTRGGLNIDLCNTQTLIDILFVFGNPAQAAYERPPGHAGPYFPTLIQWEQEAN